MTAIRRYFDQQINEIARDRVLTLYGACISIGNVLAYFNWRGEYIPQSLDPAGPAICWPFFESCAEYRFLSTFQVEAVFGIFGAVAAVGVLLFVFRRTVRVAYWWLVAVTAFKTLLYIQDFRLRANQHYMLYWAVLVFLFLPYKRNLLRYIVVAFYVAAGSLKFNEEWMSGAALYAKPLLVPYRLVPLACAYAAVMEVALVWGLLARHRWIFWGTFAQVCLFHLTSFPVVGPFYPLLMFGLLMIFPLAHLYPRGGRPEPGLLQSLIRRTQPALVYVVLAAFTFLQLVPRLMPGDERITGEGRLFALHMFDARLVCDGSLTEVFRDGSTHQIAIPQPAVTRIQCDPITNLSLARAACAKHRTDPTFVDLRFTYKARLYSDTVMKPLVDLPDFCSRDVDYVMWRPNWWILK